MFSKVSHAESTTAIKSKPRKFKVNQFQKDGAWTRHKKTVCTYVREHKANFLATEDQNQNWDSYSRFYRDKKKFSCYSQRRVVPPKPDAVLVPELSELQAPPPEVPAVGDPKGRLS